jgi:hypothetical protein
MAMGYEPTSVLWVPSQGSAPALQELISGGIDMAVCSLPEAQSLLGADEIRCVGVMAEQRDEKYPDVATFPEQGVDWSMGGWRGLAVPRATSDRRVAELEAIVRRVVDGPRFREEMTKLGYHIDVEGSEEFALTMATSDAALGKVIQEALKTEEGGDDGVPGPWLFPQILVAGLAILGVWIAAMRLRGGAQNEAASTTTTTTTTAAAAATTAGRGHWMRFVDVLVAVAFYVLVVDWLGFLLTAAAVSLYLFLRLGARWLPSLAVTVVLVPGIYLLFAKMLRVPLPTGLTPW